jgi:hypothetical protein
MQTNLKVAFRRIKYFFLFFFSSFPFGDILPFVLTFIDSPVLGLIVVHM